MNTPSKPANATEHASPKTPRQRMAPGFLIASEGLCYHSSGGELASLFAAPHLPWATGSFRDASGCINAMVEGESCGRTSRCNYCPFFQSMTQTLTEGRSVGPFLLQRTFLINGRYTDMTVRVSTRFLNVRGQRLAFADLVDVSDIPDDEAHPAA